MQKERLGGGSLLLILAVLVAACTTHPPALPSTPANGSERLMNRTSIERVSLTTEDNVSLVASYYDAPGDAVILLHQYQRNRTTWDAFAKALQRRGVASIAVDFRGHGDSQGVLASFLDADFQAMLKDADAAAVYVQGRGKHVVVIVGASIGANTAFRYSAQHKTPAALLSPGLEYHGIDINDTTSTAATLIIVAKGDSYAFSSSQELDRNNLFGPHQLVVVDGNKHGTDLLTDPAVTDALLGFLEAETKQPRTNLQ